MNKFTASRLMFILQDVNTKPFRTFTEQDWRTFQCETDTPLICESEEYVFVMDGMKLEVYENGTDIRNLIAIFNITSSTLAEKRG